VKVGYCRVSTKSAEQAASIEMQAQRLADYGCDRVLVDHGISGFREDGRKGSVFPELIDLILAGVASEVIVSNFDRTQRRAKWGAQLLDALETANCRLLELDTGTWLDPANNPTDVLMAQIRSAVQENESRTRRLKVRKALAERRAQGLYACGKLPFGYTHINGKVVPHPDHWAAAQERWQQLVELDFNLAGWIKQHDAAITPRGIKAWITNPTLRGTVHRRPGMTCEPLISPEQWADAQRCLKQRSAARGVGLDRQVHLFTGLVKCEQCGKSLHNVRDRAVARLKCKTRQCAWYGRGLRVSQVREQVINALVQRHAEMADIAASHAPIQFSPEELALVAKIEALEPFADDPDYAALLAKQKAQLAAMREQPTGPRLDLLSELFQDPQTLALATDAELRTVVIEFVDSITWLGGLESLRITLR
jgi:DNA invertase Pin-like site-specific DNA recombinase